jgi:hypothetical protein
MPDWFDENSEDYKKGKCPAGTFANDFESSPFCRYCPERGPCEDAYDDYCNPEYGTIKIFGEPTIH